MSLPSRERGLKYTKLNQSEGRKQVAPLAGAWIEISFSYDIFCWRHVAPLAGAWIEIDATGGYAAACRKSLPSRERGLKSMQKRSNKQPILVAPLAGAWIEIVVTEYQYEQNNVAPLAGAWIEIKSSGPPRSSWFGRSPRGSVD